MRTITRTISISVRNLIITFAISTPSLIRRFRPNGNTLQMNRRLMRRFGLLKQRNLRLRPPPRNTTIRVRRRVPRHSLVLVRSTNPTRRDLSTRRRLNLVQQLNRMIVHARRGTNILILKRNLNRRRRSKRRTTTVPSNLNRNGTVRFERRRVTRRRIGILIISSIRHHFTIRNQSYFMTISLWSNTRRLINTRIVFHGRGFRRNILLAFCNVTLLCAREWAGSGRGCSPYICLNQMSFDRHGKTQDSAEGAGGGRSCVGQEVLAVVGHGGVATSALSRATLSTCCALARNNTGCNVNLTLTTALGDFGGQGASSPIQVSRSAVSTCLTISRKFSDVNLNLTTVLWAMSCALERGQRRVGVGVGAVCLLANTTNFLNVGVYARLVRQNRRVQTFILGKSPTHGCLPTRIRVFRNSLYDTRSYRTFFGVPRNDRDIYVRYTDVIAVSPNCDRGLVTIGINNARGVLTTTGRRPRYEGFICISSANTVPRLPTKRPVQRIGRFIPCRRRGIMN